MYRLATALIRTGLSLAAATLLAGCVIISDEMLVTEDEAVTPLPASFAMASYEEDGAGFKRTAETPMTFSLSGKGYAASSGDMTAYFAALHDNTFLVAMDSDDGIMYGVATYADNVLEMDVILSDEKDEYPHADALPGVDITDDGMHVADRAALDSVIALQQSGELAMTPVVSYVAASIDAAFPATLTRDGEGWTAE